MTLARPCPPSGLGALPPSGGARPRTRRRWAAPVLLAAALALGLSACEAGCAGAPGVSTAGVSTAGPFRDGSADVDRQRAARLADLDRAFSPAQTLGYARARDALYAWENGRDGVCGIYSGGCVRLGPGDPSVAAGALGINAEHVWPQSMGARAEPLKSDLHHLFPERERVNASRSNLPFGEVPDDRADAWYLGDASQSRPPRADADAWSERGDGRWEPRARRKGDVARAVFYVVAVYPDQTDPTFFPPMREALLDWNRRDPPDAAEQARSAWIAGLQGTPNPFVRTPALADEIWGDGSPHPAGGSRSPNPSPPGNGPAGPDPPPAAGALSVSEVHYDNAGADTGEGVEIAGPDGARLGGWALQLVNGADGSVYRTLPLAGALDGGARWVPVPGLQNGSPDGLALLDPAGRVVEAWSWEGPFAGADGTAFRDLGVAEGPGTPAGTSLQRVGGRWRAGLPASPGRPNR